MKNITIVKASRTELHSIRQHLLRLSISDRYLRFCAALSDGAIDTYTGRLTFTDKDTVYVAVYDDANVVGMLHVAIDAANTAEFALSVDEQWRKHGIGDALFDKGIQQCCECGITQVYMSCLASNVAIKRMAHKRGMTITTDYGESVARLKLADRKSVLDWLASTNTIGLYDSGCKMYAAAMVEYMAAVKKQAGIR